MYLRKLTDWRKHFEHHCIYSSYTAALLHATWNALLKGGEDKFLGMTAVVLGHVPIAFVLLFFVPVPAPESWPFIATGIGLHIGYQLFLLYSYRIGDLTQVYPIARGSAPLMVAAVSVLYLGTDLNRLELISVLIIGAGIISLSFVRQADGLKNGRAAVMALGTGCFIAAYSINDGLGAARRVQHWGTMPGCPLVMPSFLRYL